MSDKKHEYILVALGLLMIGLMFAYTIIDSPKLKANNNTEITVIIADNSETNDGNKSDTNKSSVYDNSKETEYYVNINEADFDELLTLDGIGPERAQSIIDYRTEIGSFDRIEDITNISGIGENTFDAIADRLTV